MLNKQKIFDYFFKDFLIKGETEEVVTIGENNRLDTDFLIRCMDKWCEAVDVIISKDITWNNGDKFSEALKSRAYTYSEYIDLFNEHLEDYIEYPAFQYLQISTDGQRRRFTMSYEPDEQDYQRSLEENGANDLLSFFLRKQPKFITVPIEAKTMHELIVAGTGSGKSVLMASEAYNDSYKLPNWSQVIIDPHGSYARLVFESKLHKHDERVMFFDIRMLLEGWRWGINPLDIRKGNLLEKNNVIDQLASAFADVLSKEGGDIRQNVNTVMKKCIEFLIETRGEGKEYTLQTLLDLVCYEEYILKEAQEYDKFFRDEFTKTESQTVKAVRRRLRAIIDDKVLNMILGGQSTFDLEKSINSDKILIFDLSAVGEESQQTIGKFLIAMVKGYVRRRVKDKDPNHTLLKVDEFQNFITGSLSFMLEQLRGYGLHCSLACQSIAQLGAYLQTVIDNTAIKIVKAKYVKNIMSITNVPEKYIRRGKRGDDSTQADGLLKLAKREFLLDVRQRLTVQSFHSPGFLVTSKKYRLTEEEIETSMNKQLKDYYHKIDSIGDTKEFRTVEEDVDLDMFYVPED